MGPSSLLLLYRMFRYRWKETAGQGQDTLRSNSRGDEAFTTDRRLSAKVIPPKIVRNLLRCAQLGRKENDLPHLFAILFQH